MEKTIEIPEGYEARIEGNKVILEPKESEDERIRKGLLRHFKSKTKPYWSKIAVKDIIAYLERQKEPHFTKRNALFDKCVKNCDPAVMKEVSDSVDKMLEKEQKESEDERIRKAALEGIEYLEHNLGWDAIGDIDIFDVKEYLEWQKYKYEVFEPIESTLEYKAGFRAGIESERQKEQKIARWKSLGECSYIPDGHYVVGWFRHGDFRLGIMCNGLFVDPDGNRAEQPKEVFYIPNADEEFVYAKQKFAKDKDAIKSTPKQDYSGLTDFERAIHRGFLCAGMENVSVGIIKDTAQDCLAQIKPAEWTEEDEIMLENAISSINHESVIEGLKSRGISFSIDSSTHLMRNLINWLESLRPLPHWKPSEEQIYSLGTVVKGYDNCTVGSVAYNLKGLYEQLRKLL